MTIHLYSALVRPCCIQLWPPRTRHPSSAASSVEDDQYGNGGDALGEETEGLGLLQTPEGTASGDWTAACLYLEGRKDRDRLFTVVPHRRMIGNGIKVKKERFRLGKSKNSL